MQYDFKQKTDLWNISPAVIAYNAARMGLPKPLGLYMWPNGNNWPDISGNHKNGTFTGDPELREGGLWFDGTNDLVDIQNYFDSTLTRYFVAALCKFDSAAVSVNFIATQRESTPIFFQLDNSYSDARFIVRDNSNKIVIATYPGILDTLKYFSIVGVRDKNTVKVYVYCKKGPNNCH